MDTGFANIDFADHPIEQARMPNTVTVPLWLYVGLKRRFMSKRGFRRWRAKTLARFAALRQAARANG